MASLRIQYFDLIRVLMCCQQMHVLPDTELMFVNNTASQFGGAIAAENFRGGNDTALILNNFCFIQYDIGGEHEYKPDNWKVKYLLCIQAGGDSIYTLLLFIDEIYI